MARVGALRMAQNNDRTKFILMVRNLFWCNFWLKNVRKHSLCCDSNPLPIDMSEKKLPGVLEFFTSHCGVASFY